MLLAACGFEPVYRQSGAADLQLSGLSLPQTENGRVLERALMRRITLSETGPSAEISLETSSSDLQLDAQGEAQRYRLSYQARLVLTAQSGTSDSAGFTAVQFMSAGDGADELGRRRALNRAAMRLLADKIIGHLAARPSSEAGR